MFHLRIILLAIRSVTNCVTSHQWTTPFSLAVSRSKEFPVRRRLRILICTDVMKVNNISILMAPVHLLGTE